MVADPDRVRVVKRLTQTVDLAYHPLTLPLLICAAFYDTNKLVSKGGLVPWHVAFDNF